MKASCDRTPVADKNRVTFSSKSPWSPVPSPKIRYVGLVSSCLGSGSTLPVGFITSCLSSGGTVVELSRKALESGRGGKKVSRDLRVNTRVKDVNGDLGCNKVGGERWGSVLLLG